MPNRTDPTNSTSISKHADSLAGAAITRREALPVIGLAMSGGAWPSGTIRETEDAEQEKHDGDPEALDEAYRSLQKLEPQSTLGLSTHAPMVAEALCRLGHAERVPKWIRGYNGPLRELPPPSSRIEPANWRAALGPRANAATWEAENARWGDWKEFFTAELAEHPWRSVLDQWVARLAPGMCGAATHGVIRTSHAVRAMAQRETPERRGELARGLAYWASSYEELPANGQPLHRFDTFATALAEVPLYWQAFGHTPEGRNIVEALRHVRELGSFAQVRNLVAMPVDLTVAISALTATFTRVYLRHGSKHDTIAFVHSVTGPCSLRRMAPHIKPETARAALPFAWQTAAAIYSAYARPGETRPEPASKQSPPELAANAIKRGDAHGIKFTEVMLSEHKLNPDPVYLAAAEDAVGRL